MPLTSDDIEYFGRALRHLRQRCGLGQRVVAQRTGISVATLPKYESHQNSPAARRLIPLLHVLGADFTDLQQAIDLVRRSQGAADLYTQLHELETRVRKLERLLYPRRHSE